MATLEVGKFKLKINPETNKVDKYSMPYQPRNKRFAEKNNFFDLIEGCAVSYNWWTYLCKIKGKWVFNDHNYSVTTCGHQAEMKRLAKELGIKIAIFIDTRSSLNPETFRTNALRSMYTKLISLEMRLNNKNVRDKSGISSDLSKVKKDIKLARSLGAKFTLKDIANLRTELAADEKSRLERNRAKRLADKDAAKARALEVKTLTQNNVEFQLTG